MPYASSLRPLSLLQVGHDHPNYPSRLGDHLGTAAPVVLTAIGNLDILKEIALGLFCSVKCPGKLIVETYDLAQRLRHAGVPVISGFHSPMERECLVQLLRGPQPVITCPARNLKGMRIPTEHREALEKGRLLYLSPFAGTERRSTTEMAVYRNRFVAALAGRIFVAHAEPGGKTEAFCREVISWGKPLLTLESESNGNLIALGAKPVTPERVSESW